MLRCVVRGRGALLRTFQCLRAVACAGVAAAAVGWGAPACAVDYFWTLDTGGPFSAPQLWDPFPFPFGPFGPGGAGDTVNFDLGASLAGQYTVTNVTGENGRLLVHDDSLTLVVPETASMVEYAVVNASAATPSVAVGVASGDVGRLTLTGGKDGRLESKYTSLGVAAGSAGHLVVDKMEFVTFDDLWVGAEGSGTMTVQKGGLAVNLSSRIGDGSNATGDVIVDGEDSLWVNSGMMYVGASGVGTVTVVDGGTVFAAGAVILGDGPLGGGTVIVDGPGSTWTSQTTVFVASNGDGVLTIRNGGTMTSPSAYIGTNSVGAESRAIVDGAGSTWSNGADIVVGFSAGSIGELEITGGGAASSVGGTMGQLVGSAGAVLVTGAGSTWTSDAVLNVGLAGYGVLRIENGGALESDGANIGSELGAIGEATVDGAGSTWSSSAGIYVGGNAAMGGGSGTLTITDQAEVTAVGPVTVWSGGVVNLDGGVLTTAALVQGGGPFHWTAGKVRITGAPGLTIGVSGFFGATLAMDSSQHLEVDQSLAVLTGSMLSVKSPLKVGSATVFGGGELQAVDTIDAGFVLVSAGGKMILGGAVQDFGSGAAIQGVLELQGVTVVEGTVVIASGGEIQTNNESSFNGAVSGPGGFTGAGEVTFAGDYSPGASAAAVNFAGGVVFGASNVLAIELGGVTAGTQHDQLLVTGDATLGGTLAVSLIGGFMPALGQTFSVVQAGSVTGVFTLEDLPDLPGLLGFDVTYSMTGVQLEVVAVPPMAGDFDEDGDVDGDDLTRWSAGYGASGSAGHGQGDADGDMDVDGADFLAWQRELGSGAPIVAASVPEPRGLALVILAGAVVGLGAGRARF